ncbi:MAG: TlpA family protein disulfide reductase [Alphaproteobacteria bacterium]|nr:TlpA family protein disulfide reductase [Alphaproteobacteria bacterium]
MTPALRRLIALLLLTLAPAAWASPAHDFTLRDVNGQSVSLASLKGKVVVLSFWATWCGPCKEEMPHLDKLYGAKKDAGLVVLSISTDDARTASKVKPFIASKGFSFPVLLDRDSSVVGIYNPSKSLPYTVLIGRDFEVVEAHTGYDPGDEVALAAKIDKLLAAPAP